MGPSSERPVPHTTGPDAHPGGDSDGDADLCAHADAFPLPHAHAHTHIRALPHTAPADGNAYRCGGSSSTTATAGPTGGIR